MNIFFFKSLFPCMLSSTFKLNFSKIPLGVLNMPIDLILVRHGSAEGNKAFNESRKGNNSLFTDKFMSTHESKWRLTPEGRQQAIITGNWIRKNISSFFGTYITSEYIRALETAAYLDLPNPLWNRNVFLRERNFGRLSSLNYEEREKRFSHEIELRKRDAFYWVPPSGESLADLALRVDYVIGSLTHQQLRPSSAIIVTHFNVMQVFRARIEQIMQSEFEKKLIQVPEHLKIKNCSIIHYTRKNPITNEINETYKWFKIITPWINNKKFSNPDWNEINYRVLTNNDIFKEIKEIIKK